MPPYHARLLSAIVAVGHDGHRVNFGAIVTERPSNLRARYASELAICRHPDQRSKRIWPTGADWILAGPYIIERPCRKPEQSAFHHHIHPYREIILCFGISSIAMYGFQSFTTSSAQAFCEVDHNFFKPARHGALHLCSHYRIDLIVFYKFIDHPAFKGFLVPPREIVH
jgi:hypothetical protein